MRVQSQGAEQIREAIIRLSEGANQTSISLREFNKATDHLREAVGGLKEEVSRFTLGDSSRSGRRSEGLVIPNDRRTRPQRRRTDHGRQTMLLLTFTPAGNRYAVDVARVVELVPAGRAPRRPARPGLPGRAARLSRARSSR